MEGTGDTHTTSGGAESDPPPYHGFLSDPSWPLPVKTVHCDREARPVSLTLAVVCTIATPICPHLSDQTNMLEISFITYHKFVINMGFNCT
jgi:hypothetical protein